MKTLLKTSGALLFIVFFLTLVQAVHADTTNAQNFGDILNQAKNISNTGANQINNGSITTGNATAGQNTSNTINTSATGCNCTPTPSAQPTPSPTLEVSPTPTNTPGGGGNGSSNTPPSSNTTSSNTSNSGPTQAVLGASTMAGTGTFETSIMNFMLLAGMMVSGAGLLSYAKEKKA